MSWRWSRLGPSSSRLRNCANESRSALERRSAASLAAWLSRTTRTSVIRARSVMLTSVTKVPRCGTERTRFAREALQRFADWRSSDRELLPEAALVHHGAGRHVQRDDAFADAQVGFLALRASRARALDLRHDRRCRSHPLTYPTFKK